MVLEKDLMLNRSFQNDEVIRKTTGQLQIDKWNTKNMA